MYIIGFVGADRKDTYIPHRTHTNNNIKSPTSDTHQIQTVFVLHPTHVLPRRRFSTKAKATSAPRGAAQIVGVLIAPGSELHPRGKGNGCKLLNIRSLKLVDLLHPNTRL